MIDKIEVNCHSSIKIKGDKVIYVDPYKIREEVHDADYIFITHDHYDHFDLESIKKVIKDNTVIVFPDKMAIKLLGNFRKYDLRGVVPQDKYEINGLKFETVSSYNINKNFHLKEYNWVGYVLEIDNERIYVTGDTDITEESKEVKCDILMLPIGGTYTMDAKEAATLTNIIKPREVIPIHYGLIVGDERDLELFKSLVDDKIDVVVKIK